LSWSTLGINELLELVSGGESDREQVLESVGDHVWNRGGVWKTRTEGQSGNCLAVALEDIEEIVRVDVDGVLIKDGAWS
jgi:hypothetical protein